MGCGGSKVAAASAAATPAAASRYSVSPEPPPPPPGTQPGGDGPSSERPSSSQAHAKVDSSNSSSGDAQKPSGSSSGFTNLEALADNLQDPSPGTEEGGSRPPTNASARAGRGDVGAEKLAELGEALRSGERTGGLASRAPSQLVLLSVRSAATLGDAVPGSPRGGEAVSDSDTDDNDALAASTSSAVRGLALREAMAAAEWGTRVGSASAPSARSRPGTSGSLAPALSRPGSTGGPVLRAAHAASYTSLRSLAGGGGSVPPSREGGARGQAPQPGVQVHREESEEDDEFS